MDIQTAIAETEAARPTPTAVPVAPTDTPVAIIDIVLVDILNILGPFPIGLSLEGIPRDLPSAFSDAPVYVNAINMRFLSGSDISGGITILLYNTLREADAAYIWAEEGYTLEDREVEISDITITFGSIPSPGIGDKSVASYVDESVSGFITDRMVFVVFQICRAVSLVHVSHPNINNEDVFRISNELEAILASLVCP